jgi:hypothetical protein
VALSEKDLRILLKIDPRTDAMAKAIKGLGASIDKVYQDAIGGATKWSNQQVFTLRDAVKGFAAQREEMNKLKILMAPDVLAERVRLEAQETAILQEHNKLLSELRDKDPLAQENKRFAVQQEMTAELRRQRDVIKEVDALSDPKHLREKVALEHQLSVAQGRREIAQLGQVTPQQVQEQAQVQRQVMTARGRQERAETVAEFRQAPLHEKFGQVHKALQGGEGLVGKGISLAGTGALGEGAMAAAGPAGTIATIALTAAKVVGKIAVAPLQAVGAGLDFMSSGLHELQGSLGPVGLGFTVLGKSIDMVSKVIPVVGPMVSKAFMGILGPMKDITGSLVSMAAVASPGAFKIWTMALEDVQGVIGQTFTPVLQIMTEGVRLFGDVLATVLPSMDEMTAILDEVRPAFNSLKNEIKAFFGEFGSTIRGFISGGLRVLMNVLGQVMRFIGQLTRTLGNFMRGLGLAGPQESVEGRSVGAAARPAQIQGLEEYSQQLQRAAFMGPSNQGVSPQVDAVNWLQTINSSILELPMRIALAINEFVNPLSNRNINSIAQGGLYARELSPAGLSTAIVEGFRQLLGGE